MPATALSYSKVAASVPKAAARPIGAARAIASRPVSRSVSNGSRVNMMQVVNPHDKFYETLSYLPQLSDSDIARQVEYITYNNWSPCVEFDCIGGGEISRDHLSCAGYYDGRYWAMWKLPMFGCTDPRQVLEEIQACRAEYPESFIRVIGFDPNTQVQVVSFIVAKPSAASMARRKADTRASAVSKLETAYQRQPVSSYRPPPAPTPPPSYQKEPVSYASRAPAPAASSSGLESRLSRMEDAIDRIEKALGSRFIILVNAFRHALGDALVTIFTFSPIDIFLGSCQRMDLNLVMK